MNFFILAYSLLLASPNYKSVPVVFEEPSTVIIMPEVVIIGYAPIPKETQNQLNYLLARKSNSQHLVEDGLLGKESRKALNWFVKTYNISNLLLDKDVFALVEDHYKKEISSELVNPNERFIPNPSVK